MTALATAAPHTPTTRRRAPSLRLVTVIPPDDTTLRTASEPVAAVQAPTAAPAPTSSTPDVLTVLYLSALAEVQRSQPNVISLLDTIAGELRSAGAFTQQLRIRVVASERAAEQAIRGGDIVAGEVAGFQTELRCYEKRLIAVESGLERIYQMFGGMADAMRLHSAGAPLTAGDA